MILGIDLGGTNIRLAQIIEGRIHNKVSAPSPAKMQMKESIEYLKSIIRPLITSQVRGIGIGVPSVMDSERGIVYNVTFIPAWIEVHLKEILETEFEIPVYINNDSNCFALGEKRFGEGSSFENIVGITLGTGVGAGIVYGDLLISGSNTGAGEIGCLKYLDATYEDYCASNFFTTHYNLTGEKLAILAQSNDPTALRIWSQFGEHIGQLMQAVLYAYDPDAIILGGGISRAFNLYSESMYRSFDSFLYSKTIEKIQIKVSKNPDIAILGAAALVQ